MDQHSLGDMVDLSGIDSCNTLHDIDGPLVSNAVIPHSETTRPRSTPDIILV